MLHPPTPNPYPPFTSAKKLITLTYYIPQYIPYITALSHDYPPQHSPAHTGLPLAHAS